MKSLFLAVCLASWSVLAAGQQAPQVPPAMESYEYVANIRDEAEKVVKDSNGSIESMQAAVKRLESALVFLQLRGVRDQAAGNEYLFFRELNVRLDLADLYVKLGLNDKAVSTLVANLRSAWVPTIVEQLKSSESLRVIRDDIRFKQFLATSDLPSKIYANGPTFSDYKPVLSIEERVAGLSLFWTQVRSDFVYFDHAPSLNWDEAYLEYLRKVIAAKTTVEYYRVLMQLAPLLNDGHTNIYPPEKIANRFYSRPPMTSIRIQNRVFIEAISSPALRGRVQVGDEILKIDGVAVDLYAERKVRPFVSSSTPQDRELRMYTYQLLGGDAKTAVTLALRSPNGHVRTVAIPRSGFTDVTQPAKFQFRKLPGDVTYLSLDHFESKDGVAAFQRAFPEILNSKALILDLRRNGGGSTSYGHEILRSLTNLPFPSANSYVRADSGFSRNDGNAITWKPLENNGDLSTPTGKTVFKGRVIVLVGPRTFSAAEDFLVSFKAINRGLLIGESTGGSTGQPIMMRLPGGGTGRICVKRDTLPDGIDFVGKGFLPDIEVKRTVKELWEGADPVLARAVVEARGAAE